MNNFKRDFKSFVKNEKEFLKIIINLIVFSFYFFNNLNEDGILIAFLAATFFTVSIAAVCYFILNPLLNKVLKIA